MDPYIKQLQYQAIHLLLKLLSLVPRSLMSGLAIPAGRIWHAVDFYHRKIATDNMQRAFESEFSSAQIRQMVRNNFIQTARVFLEIPSLLNLRKRNLDSYVVFSGEAHLKQALAEGKGVLFLSAHFGNWEIMTVSAALHFDIPIHAIVRPLDAAIVEKLLHKVRSRTGNSLIDKQKAGTRVHRLLRKNQAVGILLDQNASWYEGVYVPLFGQIACTNKGLAMFAGYYDTPIIPVFNYRLPDGRYKIIFDAPLPVIRSNEDHAVVANTLLFNQTMERFIRMAPDNWFWVHRRWLLKDIPANAKGSVLSVAGFNPTYTP